MTSKELIKERLYNDTDELIKILENLGCHHINTNYGPKEIRCALPDGTNVNSVSVILSPFVPCRIFSRSKYNNDFDIRDIFAFVQFIRGCTFREALAWLCEQLGIENDGVVICQGSFSVLKDIRREKRVLEKQNHNVFQHTILDSRILERYQNTVVQQWVAEGITPEVQEKYGIRDDQREKRWLIPIYTEAGDLVSIKGRTYAPNWEELGINKYVYYYRLGVADILFGYNFNAEKMKERNEIILAEAEKSVMAADAYGYGWCSSLGTNSITAPLFQKILKLPCANVVLAFDKDVDWKTAKAEADKLKRYKNVWIIYDQEGVLRAKESPMDKGRDIFERLYKNKIRI